MRATDLHCVVHCSRSDTGMRMISANGLQLGRCPNPLVQEVFDKKQIPLADGSWTAMDVWIPREEGDFLYSLVRRLRPRLTLEVGMANGVSTLFIAQALMDNDRGRHLAIDPFQYSEWKGAGKALLERGGLDSLVDLIEKPSHQALPELEQAGKRVQFAFIDGSHLFDYVMTDFLCCDRLLDVDGLMAFDDSDWPAITQVIRFAVTNRKYVVAHPEVVIEPPSGSSSLLGRLTRHLGQALPRFGEKLRPDFLTPSHQLGVRGRCVVLRKTCQDERNSQSRCHNAF
jgi:predicted O-methyltransferase YrrM